jgi:hypothetical protein
MFLDAPPEAGVRQPMVRLSNSQVKRVFVQHSGNYQPPSHTDGRKQVGQSEE